MSTKLIKTLSDFGLSENQSRVYLASLSLGPAKATAVAQQAGIKRTTVYPVIESLIDQGLISITLRGWKKLYQAEAPEKLEEIATRKYLALRESITELSELNKTKARTSEIKYAEGVKEVTKSFEGMIKKVRPKDNYYIIAKGNDWYDMDPEFFDGFIERRSKLDINIRCLMIRDERGEDYLENGDKYNLKIKFLPGSMRFSCNLVFIPERVLITSTKKEQPWSLVIEDTNVPKIFSELFELIWGGLPDPNS